MRNLKDDILKLGTKSLPHRIWAWFTDQDSGAIRRFYLLIGVIIIGYWIKNYHKEQSVIAHYDEVIKDNAIKDYQIEQLSKELTEIKTKNEQERNQLRNMSTDERIQYLTDPTVFPNAGNDSETIIIR